MIQGKSELSILPNGASWTEGGGDCSTKFGISRWPARQPEAQLPRSWSDLVTRGVWVSDSDFREADVNLLQWFGWLLMFIGVFKRNKVICGQLGRKKNSCGTPAYSIPTKYVKYKWNTDNLRIPQSATTTTCSRGHHEFLQKNEWMNTCTYI